MFINDKSDIMIDMSFLGWFFVIELVTLLIYFALLARKKILNQEGQINILAKEGLPYKLHQFTLSDSEKEFFNLLNELEVVKNNFYIFPQLTLDKLVYIPDEFTNKWIYLNEINRKFVDFTLFDKKTLLPKIVIELNGDPHVTDEKVRNRDVFIKNIFDKVGIKLLSIPRADYNYDRVKINEKIKKFTNYYE